LDDYVIFTDHFWRNNFNKLITDQNGSQKWITENALVSTGICAGLQTEEM
jgi:hypothetical protein